MTFSIVARDPDSGALGVATSTGGPCVGVFVPHARSGLGAIATQGDTNPHYGHDGLSLLAEGLSAEDVLAKLTEADAGRASRQVVVIGTDGPPAAFTGTQAYPFAGTVLNDDFAIAGNMLADRAVIDGMALAYETTIGPFEDRLLAALFAGEAAGGDIRGLQSAALLIYSGGDFAAFDCRVDLSPAPLVELSRVVAATRTGSYADFASSRPRRTFFKANA